MEIESTVNAGQESVVETQDVQETTSQTEQNTVESVKSENVADSQQDKQVQSREENAKIAAARRQAEAEAKDKLISEMYGEQGIHTYADYQRAVERQAEEERRARLQERGIDPKEIEDLISNNPKVKKADEVLSKIEQQERQQAEFKAFFDYFKEENGRNYDAEKDQIPPEVWEMNAQGKSLVDAYAYVVNKQLKTKIAEYESKLKAQETNTKNAESSPGSVTGNGEIKDGYISKDQFEANKNNREWVVKNLSKISESRTKW